MGGPEMRMFAALFLTLFFFAAEASAGQAEDLQQRAAAVWRPNLPYCMDQAGKRFPSKLHANGECDDRDSVIFNGMLCASGEQEGCDAVIRSKDAAQTLPGKGAWWRSPKIALAAAKCSDPNGKCDSFSHDQGLGLMLTIVTKKSDPASLAHLNDWMLWIQANRPCVVGNEPFCMRGWPRVCRDDTEPPNWPLKGCSLRPGDLAMMQTVLSRLGLPLLPEPQPITGVFAPFEGWAAPFVLAGAGLNDLGYPSHLASAGIMIMRGLGQSTDEKTLLDFAALTLHKRQPLNPLFAYLAGQPKDSVAQLVLNVCPATQADIPAEKTEWIWERKDGSDAPKRTMLWDCVFMANLLAK